MNRTVFNPETDLQLERIVDVPRDRVWRAWTEPRHLMRWFCPRPWTTVACETDLRPGGAFSTTMRSTQGEEFPTRGCYLEVVPGERLVWTDGLTAGLGRRARALAERLRFETVLGDRRFEASGRVGP